MKRSVGRPKGRSKNRGLYARHVKGASKQKVATQIHMPGDHRQPVGPGRRVAKQLSPPVVDLKGASASVKRMLRRDRAELKKAKHGLAIKNEEVANLSTHIDVLAGACDLKIERVNKAAEATATKRTNEHQAEVERLEQEKRAETERRRRAQANCVLVHKRQEDRHTDAIASLKAEHQKDVECNSQWHEKN